MTRETAPAAPASYLDSDAGLSGWFRTNDHKRIALGFLFWTVGLFMLGAIAACLLKLSVFANGEHDVPVLNQMQTYHGVIMVFLVVVPLIPSVLGYFLLPLQLGARNMALPTMSRMAIGSYIAGTLCILVTLLLYPLSTGWTLATPYSLIDGGSFALFALGLLLVALSWVLTGGNIIVTVHRCRPDWMGFFRMPLLCWSLYLTAFVLVVSGLIFGIAIIFLALIEARGSGVLSGIGDPTNWESYFWFVTTSAGLFAMIPAVGVMSEVISGLARKVIAGYRLIVGALIALLAIALLSWGVHLVGHGQGESLSFVFSILSLLAVIPVAVIVYCWLATLYRGAVAWNTVTVFALTFLICGGIGVLLGLFLTNLSLAAYLDSTIFATAHIHYLLMGGVVTAMLTGLFYWWPKITGRIYDEKWGVFAGVVYLIGFNLAFFPQIIMGTLGQPAGIHDFAAEMADLNRLSATGMGVLAVGLALILTTLIISLLKGAAAPANPWGVASLEWRAASPPSRENFDATPEAIEPYVG
ncbi:MAG: cytochrome c oxidase subunit I [bacterium]|nr:cytochrome c oxidase subunit I [bacterium]